MDLVRRVIAYKNNKIAGMSTMQINQALAYDQSDCDSCDVAYDWSWVNREGYGTTAWAPTMLTSSQSLGWNNRRDDFLVTYLR